MQGPHRKIRDGRRAWWGMATVRPQSMASALFMDGVVQGAPPELLLVAQSYCLRAAGQLTLQNMQAHGVS